MTKTNSKQEALNQEAIEKGWMPAKPWKGKIRSLFGKLVRVGWNDAKPDWGIMTDVFKLELLSLENGIIYIDDASQIFEVRAFPKKVWKELTK